MAFNEETAGRISQVFKEKKIKFSEKKMFSGVCFMVDDKMCCGTHTDKNTGEDLLLCRIGVDEYDAALKKEGCIQMEFTGKSMKGFVYVKGQFFRNKRSLSYWLQLCLDFNPSAKKSKKKTG